MLELKFNNLLSMLGRKKGLSAVRKVVGGWGEGMVVESSYGFS